MTQSVSAPGNAWSVLAWKRAEPVYQRILDLDFIRELAAGTLARGAFLFYINQDALYLDAFGRALASLAVRLDKPGHRAAFLSFAGDTMSVERALHESFLKDAPRAAEPSPSCLLYTSHVLRLAALAPVETALAAVLPCFWIYKEVGDHILAIQTKDDNPYQDWINTYGGEEYAAAVTRAVAICDDMAAAATPARREEMTQAYVLCSKMEWMFWDSAYRLEQWPV